MALEGTLKDLSLPDIIQFLSLSRKTGALEINGTDGFGTGKLYFHQGKVVSASLEDMPPLEAAYSFFTFPDGSFHFTEAELDSATGTPINMSNEFLIIEGIRRADEWEKLRDRIPTLDLILGLVADPVAGNRDINLKPDEWRVLTMINGRESIRQIARRTVFGDFKTARIVYHLLSAGLIEPLGRATPPPPPPAPPPVQSRESAPGPGPPVQNGSAGGPARTGTAPLNFPPAPGPSDGQEPLPTRPTGLTRPLPANAVVPEPPALRPSPGPAPPSGPRVVSGAALYSRFETIAVSGLGNSGRLLVSTAYQRMRLQPAADITQETALKFCEQFERDASMLAGSSRARQIAERLRQAVNESFRG